MTASRTTASTDLTMDRLDKTLKIAKWGWGLLVSVFLFGAAANYQLVTIRYENEKQNCRIENLEKVVISHWTTPMIADLSVYTCANLNTNRTIILTEKQMRDLVSDIHERYTK